MSITKYYSLFTGPSSSAKPSDDGPISPEDKANFLEEISINSSKPNFIRKIIYLENC